MKKNLSIVAIIITIIGIIVVAVKGYNVDLRYRAHQSISASIGTEFNVEDIKAITNDVFGKQEVKIEKAGIYEDEVYYVVRLSDIYKVCYYTNVDTANVNINRKIGKI